MRKTKMDSMIALAKKGTSAVAEAVRDALVPLHGSLVIYGEKFTAALTKRGLVIANKHGAKSITCTVLVKNKDGEVVIARGQTQAKGTALPKDATELRALEEEALLQACEAHLRETVKP